MNAPAKRHPAFHFVVAFPLLDWQDRHPHVMVLRDDAAGVARHIGDLFVDGSGTRNPGVRNATMRAARDCLRTIVTLGLDGGRRDG